VYVPRDLSGKTETLLSLRKFQTFNGYFPVTKDKGQPNSLLHREADMHPDCLVLKKW
jgi:hypothetical protein